MSIVLGIDPGVSETGWAVLEGSPGNTSLLKASGIIRTTPKQDLPERLCLIHAQITQLFKDHAPDSVAIEQMFFIKAATTIRATLQARGVILLAAAQSGKPIAEYDPRTVKATLTGSGAADKSQMQIIVKKALGLADILRPDDVADAAAIALCHLRSTRFKRLKVLDSFGGNGENPRKMIASLRGTVLVKETDRVIIEAAGVGYEVSVTSSTFSHLPPIGQEAFLHIEESFGMYGGSVTLYGFVSLGDRAMFAAFRDNVPSTGAKKALEFLEKASKSLPDFRRAILEKDVKLLTGVFGFTRKTAERLVEALKDKLESVTVHGSEKLSRKDIPLMGTAALSQALSALAALGYKPNEAKIVLQSVAEESGGRELEVEQIVRLALKKF